MPDGLARRSLGLFIKGADAGAVLVYKDALPLDCSLKLAQYLVEQGSVVEYNLVEENCDKFAATCRLGRCVDKSCMPCIPAPSHPHYITSNMKSKLLASFPLAT
jgi:hypothetical protein